MNWRVRNLRRRPEGMSACRWLLGNLWRKLLYACGLHWKQRRGPLTWYRLMRLIRSRMVESAERWDYIIRREPCVYCGRLLAFQHMTVEHVIPKSRGGADVSLNKVGCCATCNRRRGSMPLLHFLLQRQGVDVGHARRNHILAHQARMRAQQGKLLRHGPAPALVATMQEHMTWKAATILDHDRRNRKTTDLDLRSHADG